MRKTVRRIVNTVIALTVLVNLIHGPIHDRWTFYMFALSMFGAGYLVAVWVVVDDGLWKLLHWTDKP